VTPDLLRRLPLFAEVPDSELARLAPLACEVTIQAGDVLMEEGTPADAFYLVLEGRLAVTKRTGDQDVQLNDAGPGEVLGELALVAHRLRSATVTAVTDARVLEVREEGFHDLLGSPTAAEAILRTVMQRLENQEVQLRQHAKMAALGTLTAGLLHDLNNPAAAVSRGVGRLPDLLARLAPGGEQLAGAVPREPPSTDPLERADRTDALEAWLAEQGLDEAWDVAGSLAEQGWQPDELAELLAGQPVEEAVAWLGVRGEVDQLVEELAEGARRISEIVASVKAHSRADEDAKPVDVHEGLESTLVLLRFKLRDGVEVVREYAEEPVVVEGYPGELNQVWSNLIDNAIDAMDGSGELTLRTAVDAERVTVEVGDNGCGIPEDARDRIFEPFFTTKEVGQGSGVGLATVFRIVVQQHRGSVDVASEPGRTVFTVRLPRRLA
jgi:signal transduction histidine kinase